MSRWRRAARRLGRTGLWLSAVLVGALWTGLGLTLVPAQVAVQETGQQLRQLDRQLGEVEQVLSPLDSLGRPQTLAAVRALGQLARTAQGTPVVDMLLGQDTLGDAVTLTRRWEQTLAQPPSGRLTGARALVQRWQRQVETAGKRLIWTALALGLVGTLAVGWFAAGQWALFRYAGQEQSSEKG
ncbi:hypothetical protein [Deinococcus hohokamensis]|uniref:Uncharacterized protein n=1 Tax=Deinococcus hohokamensis TaxID=309883 RepID=A0ABV9I8U3_9DEIO